MSAPVDVLAVMDEKIRWAEQDGKTRAVGMREARAAVADLVEGPLSQKARLEHLLSSLKFDEQLRGHNPERSTLDFPHAISIVESAIAALARVGGDK